MNRHDHLVSTAAAPAIPIARTARRSPCPLALPLAAMLGALAGAPRGAHAEGVELVQGIVPAWSGPANNWPFPSGIDAAVNFTETAGPYDPSGQSANYGANTGGREGKLYFFKGPLYSRYDIATDRTDPGYPLTIANHWPGFPPSFTTGVDAAVNWGNLNPLFANKVYFFKGAQYIRYDIKNDAVDPGYLTPQPLDSAHWAGWPASPSPFASGVDAALNYGNGKVYFFKGNQYLRFDIATDRVDQAPQPIAGHWPGWPAAWSSVDDAVDTGNGKVYFFRGSSYARYDKGYLAPATMSNIKHVVLIVQENHTFDNYFGAYCTGGLGLPCGSLGGYGPACCEAAPLPAGTTTLYDVTNAAYSPDHSTAAELCEINHGAMNRFASGCTNSDARNVASVPASLLWLSAYDPVLPGLSVYAGFAQDYALADRYFQPLAGPSYPNNAYFSAARYLFGDNTVATAKSCKTAGPHLGSVLADHDITWASYLQEGGNSYGNGAANTCGGGDYGDNPFGFFPRPDFWDSNWTYTRQLARLATDVADGTLPTFSFVKAENDQSEHPGGGVSISAGERFVQSIVDTVLGAPGSPSPYYNDTLVLLTWDEGGGYWDHVSPPADSTVDNVAGYGAAVPYGDRVPLLAIGRFAKVGYVSHVRMEHASIVNFVEWNWLSGVTGQLDTLVSAAGPTSHARDAYANNIGDLLDPTRTGVTVPRTP